MAGPWTDFGCPPSRGWPEEPSAPGAGRVQQRPTRDEALARLAVFAGQVARLYEAFDALAAHERLAEDS